VVEANLRAQRHGEIVEELATGSLRPNPITRSGDAFLETESLMRVEEKNPPYTATVLSRCDTRPTPAKR
jgi:hypothetical protein